ncbi:MAG TPA: crossover junction endodeoxyribonuclease RuvC [Patescibacteria group bacterium]|nr:crossover junction endodeoxyribonuclease RuvC [Patescibacteria group bacterium]
MIVLGIDPGIGRTGWGVIEVKGSRNTALAYDCFETPATRETAARLVDLRAEILRIIKKHKPEMVGIEELFFNTNAKTAMVVGQARGVVLEAIAENGIPIISMTPPEIKTAVAGYGKADKDQVGKMVKMLLGLPSVPKPDDTADALACALACSFSYKMKLA